MAQTYIRDALHDSGLGGRVDEIERGMGRYCAAVFSLVAFSVWLRWEALETEFFADDFAQVAMLEGRYPLRRSPLDLFTFSDGSLAEGRALIDAGFYPWFTDPELRLSMLRPLASAMFWLDHAMFGRSPLGYHLHGALWWCVLLAAIAYLYRGALRTGTALLALALFVVDEAHAVILAWIANRSALVGVCLAVLALARFVAIDRAAAPGVQRRSELLVLSLFSLSFGFGEYALCVLGYVVAHAALTGAGPLSARARRTWPAILPAALFVVVRSALGHTPRRSGMYVDPFADPLEFVHAFITRAPVLVSDMLLALRSEHWTFGGEPWLGALFRSWLPQDTFERAEAWRAVHLGLGLVACGLFALLGQWVWTRTLKPPLRWLAVGSALSLVPVVGSFPSSRLLLVPLIGFCPLLAALFVDGLARARSLFRAGSRARSLGLAGIASVACAFHLALPTLLTHAAMLGLEHASDRALRAVLNLDADEARLPEQNIILLAAVDGDSSMYLPLARWLYGKTQPAACYTLSMTPAPYALMRVAVDAFSMDFRTPAAMLRTAAEQLLRSLEHPLALRQVVETPLFRATVLGLENGQPRRFLFRFRVPLEHESLRFMISTRAGIRTFRMPPVGRATQVPAPALPD